jgi:Phosphotransferase enzyme family
VDEEVLPGGVGNAGAVVRVGEHVLRPTNPHTPAIHALLRHVRAAGFDGVPEVTGIDPDGRERLVFIAGAVPYPPFPEWSQADRLLQSTASLLRRFHDASAGFVTPAGMGWSDELADPAGGPLICHNDICPENVVSRDGVAVALLDFDFAAPGRPLYDLGQLAKMCIPLDTPEDAARFGRHSFDPFRRLCLVADAYGLPPGREPFVQVLAESIAAGGRFVERRVERGERAFIEMWNQMGGGARYERRHEWFERNRPRFLAAVG